MLKGLLPSYLTENLIYTRNIHLLNTRQNDANHLRLPNFELKNTKKKTYSNGIKEYNELSNMIRESESFNIFKSKLKKHIFVS